MARKILDWSPAGHPRGSWPAEEKAKAFRDQGIPAAVIAELRTDRFLVVAPDGEGEQ